MVKKESKSEKRKDYDWEGKKIRSARGVTKKMPGEFWLYFDMLRWITILWPTPIFSFKTITLPSHLFFSFFLRV